MHAHYYEKSRNASIWNSLDGPIVRLDLTYVMNTRLTSKGQIVLPAELREEDRLVPGQTFEIQRISAGEYLL